VLDVAAHASHALSIGENTSEYALLNRYWRAANYLSVGQIYLLDNALLREPLQREHIKLKEARARFFRSAPADFSVYGRKPSMPHLLTSSRSTTCRGRQTK
jgi:phosphoketolase